MNAFLVDLENKPGSFAEVAEALGTRGVNITGVSGSTCGDSGRAVIMTADDATARRVLQEIRCSFTEVEVTEVSIAHQPGTLGRTTRRLADAGVNLEALLPTGMSGGNVTVAFVTDNPAKAREVLATAAAGR